MKEDIVVYMDNTFNQELKQELQRSMMLLDYFEVEGYEDDLTNLIMTHGNMDPSQLQDSFIGVIRDKIKYVLLNHTLIFDSTTFFNINEIVSALYILNDLNDFALVDSILAEPENVATKIALILSYYCNLNYSDILFLLKDYDGSFLDRLQEMSNTAKELMKNNEMYNTEDIEQINEILDIEKKYERYNNLPTLAINLINKGFKPNYDLERYLNFVKEDVIAADADALDRGIPTFMSIVINIVSLLLFSKDTFAIFKKDKEAFKTLAAEKLSEFVPNVTIRLKDTIVSNLTGFYEFLDKDKETIDE